MSSLLIIGGTGFFGKSILDGYKRGLLQPWNIRSITVLARNPLHLERDHPELLDSTITLLNSDVANCKSLPVADFVIHAAASSDALNYLIQPDIEKKNIQAGTYNYCDLAKKFHKNSRIVYCSSGAVYGQQPPEMDFLLEDFTGGLIDIMATTKKDYAAAKRDAEKAIQRLGADGLSVGIARCFTFVGPYLPRTQHFAIGNFIEDGLNKRPIAVKADHEVFRSYMCADDLVVWLMAIAASSSSECPVFNVGSDESIEIRKLAEKVAKLFNVPVMSGPLLKDHASDRYIPSIEHAKKCLGLKLNFNLNEALDFTLQKILR
ncbi:NAD(P)-dependent oxidoreductase [Polynucleobacter paneuropaeus]|uniref:NAD-dependent epimerase/dehydratase family protein n=1 Tax=Polynucleobacter paneuropaeus TaxID=2527775 RepID=UPI001BFD24EF|nr:NAD(P)-dependent oxidoreductase [Polynucleobacter paneuropaeus]QWD49711.1 NAD(P)-dependent oxidoreductase [Polynucleobacter paneuropaeus]